MKPHAPLAILLALLLALLLPVPALAGEARASGNVPVRSGPAGYFRVIDHLSDGQYVEVLRCTRQARWCLVENEEGRDGWVRGSYLVGSPAKVEVTPFEFLVTPEFVPTP